MVTIGVDSHKGSLAACAIDEAGRVLGERSFPNSPSGHRRFAAWASALDGRCRIGIEGAGNFGSALARALVASGETVVEVPSVLTARERRRVRRPGKSDPKDALAIARVVLREQVLPPANTAQLSADLKALVDYRDQHVQERTRMANRVHADLQILCPGTHAGPLTSAVGLKRAQQALERSAGVRAKLGLERIGRLREIDTEIAALARRIGCAVEGTGTRLVKIPGVGSLTAAKLIAEVGDIRRFPTKSAFAMACGTAPIPASSGKMVRHRLNRGGDRQLNRAFHVIAFVQARSHPPATAYVERKRGEGKTRMEALRCLKRHLSNVVYATMMAEARGGSTVSLDV